MFKKNKSVTFSIIATVIVLAGFFVMSLFAPMVLDLFFNLVKRPIETYYLIVATYYVCVVPVYVMLFFLLKLLFNINRSELFTRQNTRYLSIISNCFLVKALLCIPSSFFFISMVIVMAAAIMLWLLLRVVKNILQTAILLKDENDLTI